MLCKSFLLLQLLSKEVAKVFTLTTFTTATVLLITYEGTVAEATAEEETAVLPPALAGHCHTPSDQGLAEYTG